MHTCTHTCHIHVMSYRHRKHIQYTYLHSVPGAQERSASLGRSRMGVAINGGGRLRQKKNVLVHRRLATNVVATNGNCINLPPPFGSLRKPGAAAEGEQQKEQIHSTVARRNIPGNSKNSSLNSNNNNSDNNNNINNNNNNNNDNNNNNNINNNNNNNTINNNNNNNNNDNHIDNERNSAALMPAPGGRRLWRPPWQPLGSL